MDMNNKPPTHSRASPRVQKRRTPTRAQWKALVDSFDKLNDLQIRLVALPFRKRIGSKSLPAARKNIPRHRLSKQQAELIALVAEFLHSPVMMDAFEGVRRCYPDWEVPARFMMEVERDGVEGRK